MSDADAINELSPVAPPATKKRNRTRSIGVLVVLLLAIVALLSQGILHSLNYFETVDQVLAKRASFGTETMRLEGVVKSGSIVRTSTGASFYVTGSKGEVFVKSNGTPPQLFQDNIPVVVVGHFTTKTSMNFAGSQIMVKHTASYIEKNPNRVKAPNGSVR
ncbi:MAG: cytochrome c maturation protein CcmE [Acidimicrobiaceae bacterium]